MDDPAPTCERILEAGGEASLRVDAVAPWWLSNSQGRHLVDLLGGERRDEQWRAITIAQLRLLYFGAS